jgi:hypothetical protein
MTASIKRLACLALLAAAAPACFAATVVQGRSTADVYLSNLANVAVPIVSVTLPAAGQYVAIGRASIVNWTGLEDDTRCGLALAGVPLDTAVTATGGPRAPSAAGIATEAKVTATAANQVLTLQCSHDHVVSGIKADGGAELVASDTLPGPKGPAGTKGMTGPPGDHGIDTATTLAICAGVNASNPTSQSCSCANGKQIARQDSVGTCTAAGQSGSCSANGYVAPNFGGSYIAACCTCGS